MGFPVQACNKIILILTRRAEARRRRVLILKIQESPSFSSPRAPACQTIGPYPAFFELFRQDSDTRFIDFAHRQKQNECVVAAVEEVIGKCDHFTGRNL
jgi:hypothetical protein